MVDGIERAQCLLIRENKILMVKLRLSEDGNEFWCIPGGKIESGENPEEAAIIRVLCVFDNLSEETILAYNKVYSFLVDIGDQEPAKGIDPEYEEGILDVRWLILDEIPERDRVFLWMAGLVNIQEFKDEILKWGADISYPG